MEVTVFIDVDMNAIAQEFGQEDYGSLPAEDKRFMQGVGVATITNVLADFIAAAQETGILQTSVDASGIELDGLSIVEAGGQAQAVAF